ncbi:MAG: hypothetical protein KA712_11965 [Myxococcales bacterium]|nr:hypothetical protein [Myxococcales bacterium]
MSTALPCPPARARRLRKLWQVAWSAAALLTACDRTNVLETRMILDNNGTACAAEADGEALPMDTVVLRLEEAPGPSCASCPAGGCTVADVRCRCTPPKTVDLATLEGMVDGLRATNVDPSKAYCITMAVLQADHGATSTGDCACDPAWLEPARFSSWGRACGKGRGGVSAVDVRVSVACLDNGRDLPIHDCLGKSE